MRCSGGPLKEQWISYHAHLVEKIPSIDEYQRDAKAKEAREAKAKERVEAAEEAVPSEPVVSVRVTEAADGDTDGTGTDVFDRPVRVTCRAGHGASWTVLRRYDDFARLRARLEADASELPFPSKRGNPLRYPSSTRRRADQVSRLDDFANACLASQQQVGGTASAPAIYGFFGSGYLVALCSDQRLRWSSDAPHRLGPGIRTAQDGASLVLTLLQSAQRRLAFAMAQHRRLAEHCDIVLNDADVVAHVASLVHGSLVFTKATAGVIDITQRDSAISLYTEKRRGVRLVGSAVSEPSMNSGVHCVEFQLIG